MRGRRFRFLGREAATHALWAAGASSVVAGVVLALLSAPPATPAGIISYALAVVAVVVLSSIAAGVLAALWPLDWSLLDRGRPPIDAEELQSPQMRLLFSQAGAYYLGIRQVAAAARDRQICRLLSITAHDIRPHIVRMFELARQVEAYREDQLLASDWARLRERSKDGSLTPAEAEQLADLERLSRVAGVADRFIRDTLAVLGRLYAASREVAVVSDVQGTRAREAVESLQEQAAQLEHLREALRQVYLPPEQQDWPDGPSGA